MKSVLWLVTFTIKVIYMKYVVWIFCVKITFDRVNDQNRFLICVHLKHMSFI